MRSRPARAVACLALALSAQTTVLSVSVPALAQQQARASQDLITRGQQLFEDQQYEESIQSLSAALVRPSNTKAQKIDIYRYLALNYITLNRKEEAESAVRGLLAIEPTYALPTTESPRFRDFFASIRTRWEEEGRPGLVRESEAAPAVVLMKHSSPSQAAPDTAIELSARLEDPAARVTSVKLYYRSGSAGKFVELSAALTGKSVHATIPPSAVKPPLVEYYFQGLDKGGLPVVARGDAGAPLRVAVPEPSRGWVLPVAIGGGILGAAAIVGGLALAGVFKGSKSTPPATGPGGPNGGGSSAVTVTVGESGMRW